MGENLSILIVFRLFKLHDIHLFIHLKNFFYKKKLTTIKRIIKKVFVFICRVSLPTFSWVDNVHWIFFSFQWIKKTKYIVVTSQKKRCFLSSTIIIMMINNWTSMLIKPFVHNWNILSYFFCCCWPESKKKTTYCNKENKH